MPCPYDGGTCTSCFFCHSGKINPFRCSNVTRLNDGSLTLRISSVPTLHRPGLAVLPSAHAPGLSLCSGQAGFEQEAVCLAGFTRSNYFGPRAAIENLWQYTGSNLTLKRGVIALSKDVRQYVERLHVAPLSALLAGFLYIQATLPFGKRHLTVEVRYFGFRLDRMVLKHLQVQRLLWQKVLLYLLQSNFLLSQNLHG